jgi:hypothetical protein
MNRDDFNFVARKHDVSGYPLHYASDKFYFVTVPAAGSQISMVRRPPTRPMDLKDFI